MNQAAVSACNYGWDILELTTAAPFDTAQRRAEPERSHAERSGGAGGARVTAA
jgi:hypothetical protein